MRLILAAAAAAIIITNHAATAAAPPYGWGNNNQWQPAPAPAATRHVMHRARPHAHEPAPRTTVEKLQSELLQMRRELDEVRSMFKPAPAPSAALALEPPLVLAALEATAPIEERATSLPDMRLPEQPPALPVRLARVVSEEVDKARAYLVATATPGFTMSRQGPGVAIGRLHPDFAVKLAQAVRRAREDGMTHAGVFSAYRPPAFGVGGFSDKFNSLHSYGLAVDVTGIGGPGSRQAKLWCQIVQKIGLFLPYGPNNRAEFNHTQLVPTKVAARAWRRTISAGGPKDIEAMWAASGVRVPTAAPVASASMLPTVDWAP